MLIDELEEEVRDGEEEERSLCIVREGNTGLFNAKSAAVGVGARILFYPTLVYNVVRNMIEPEFRWWDEVDEVHHIEHLVIPTRDYLFAPSFGDVCLAVDFIHRNATCGKRTYVHCKAGRGRSTTIVLCYLVQYKQMTPAVAYQYVKLIRPRVLLASTQWKTVQNFFHHLRMQKPPGPIHSKDLIVESPTLLTNKNLVTFDESSFEVVSQADIDGYDSNIEASYAGNAIWAELRLAYKVQITRQAALARLSNFLIRSQARLTSSGTSIPVC